MSNLSLLYGQEGSLPLAPPGRRQWHPTPVLLPGKSHARRSMVGCSPWSRYESDTTERLHFHFSLWCIGEGNGNPLQCSCLENPRGGGAWWTAVMGSHRVGHYRSDLAAAVAVRLSMWVVGGGCGEGCGQGVCVLGCSRIRQSSVPSAWTLLLQGDGSLTSFKTFFVLASLDLHCCVTAFSSWGRQGYSLVVVHGVLT